MRDLGSSFCNIDPAQLSDAKLNAKPKTKGVVGQPKAKKSKKSEDKAGPSKPAKGSSKSAGQDK